MAINEWSFLLLSLFLFPHELLCLPELLAPFMKIGKTENIKYFELLVYISYPLHDLCRPPAFFFLK